MTTFKIPFVEESSLPRKVRDEIIEHLTSEEKNRMRLEGLRGGLVAGLSNLVFLVPFFVAGYYMGVVAGLVCMLPFFLVEYYYSSRYFNRRLKTFYLSTQWAREKGYSEQFR